MQIPLDTGIAATHVSFARTGKTDTKLQAVMASGVLVHVESANEVERLIGAANLLGMESAV